MTAKTQQHNERGRGDYSSRVNGDGDPAADIPRSAVAGSDDNAAETPSCATPPTRPVGCDASASFLFLGGCILFNSVFPAKDVGSEQ
jgi:hypothetical protein